MRLGILLVGADMRVKDMVAISQLAEKGGFSTVAIAEAWRSAWVPLSAMAAGTSTINFAPYVLNAYGRRPLLAGMSAIDFNDLSNGRLVLGVGGGNRIINEAWQGIPHHRVLTKMREYVEILQRMMRVRLGENFNFQGKIHQMDWSPAVDPGDKPTPVYLAAVFPRMLKVAAQVADGIAGGATLSADYLTSTVKPMVREFAELTGREFSRLKWTSVAVFAMHEDREVARRAAREAICHFYAPLPHPYYEFTMREQGFGDTADKLLQLMPAGKTEEAIAAIPDDCIDRLTISGTPAECQQKMLGYKGVLDDMLLLNVLPSSDADNISSYRTLFSQLDVAAFA